MATASIVALALQVHKVTLFEQDNSGCVHNPIHVFLHWSLATDFVAVLITESTAAH